MTATGDFNYRGVWEAIEAQRQARGLSKTAALKDIAWLGAGVYNKLEHGHGTTCQHITGLLRWLGRSPESFMPGVTDKPEYAIPDVGPFAVRWSMPALWAGVDARRNELGLSWNAVVAEFHWPGVKDFGKTSKYGIPMDLAMRLARWIGKPAATFMYRAEPVPPGVKSATWGTAP